jgi:hypothetical protein
MRQNQSHLATSMDNIRQGMLRVHASHEYSQKVLQDMPLQIRKLQHHLHDLQQQLKVLKTPRISKTDSRAHVGNSRGNSSLADSPCRDVCANLRDL